MGQVPRQEGRRHGNGNAQLCDDALGVLHQLQRRHLSALCRTRGDSRANGHAYARTAAARAGERGTAWSARRSEEHTSELQSLMRISYAVFCLNKTTDNISSRPNKKKTRLIG